MNKIFDELKSSDDVFFKLVDDPKGYTPGIKLVAVDHGGNKIVRGNVLTITPTGIVIHDNYNGKGIATDLSGHVIAKRS